MRNDITCEHISQTTRSFVSLLTKKDHSVGNNSGITELSKVAICVLLFAKQFLVYLNKCLSSLRNFKRLIQINLWLYLFR